MARLKLPFELEKPSSIEYVTQASEIGHNGQPLSQALGELSKLDNISKESTQSEEDAIIYETDGGVQVGKIDANGADFANLKRGGQQVARMSDLPTVPTLDTSIGGSPSNSHTPSTKAVKDYVDENIPEVPEYPIETETAQSEAEEVIFGNDAGTQEFVKIGSYGMKSKAYLDMQGNPVFDKKEIVDVIVKMDGTGDYTNVVAAVYAIRSQASRNKIHNIYIHEGTYDMVTDYYTAEGIDYTDSVKKGLILPQNVNLIGVGRRDHIILDGHLPSTVKYKTSANFSTINMRAFDNRVENLTIKVFNGRYPLHDQADGISAEWSNYTHLFRNVVSIHEGCDEGATTITDPVSESNNTTSNRWASQHAFGCGTFNNAEIICEYCIFNNSNPKGLCWGIHDDRNDVNTKLLVKLNCCKFIRSIDNKNILTFHTMGTGDKIAQVIGCTCDISNAIVNADKDSNLSTYNFYVYGYKPAANITISPSGLADNFYWK